MTATTHTSCTSAPDTLSRTRPARPSAPPSTHQHRPPSAEIGVAGPAALTVTVARRAGTTELSLAGELEASTAPLLDCLVADALDRRRDVSLDLSRTEFCDVKGLNCLLATRRRVHAHGRRLTFVGAQPLLRHLLGVSGAADVLAADG
ncbi:STAS domain-containing protein [Kineococcus sp. R8]|uniref:STAS domain-containing protein n=1 Tax=Kineococcus siccus TaxID=2696567 RepID=UPI001412BF16|nr:STAS domain-containing protein [Kineococcus siccus]NAZ83751.1 STAS domain-containing protein [Kineococcus siccus]